MKKKLVSAGLAISMVACFAACGAASESSVQATTAAQKSVAKVSDTNGAAVDAEASGDSEVSGESVKMATGGQDSLPSYAATIDVVNEFNSAQDALNIEYYGARQLGDDDAIVQQVMSGTIQLGGVGATALSTYTNLLDGFTIPFLINSYEKERIVIQSDEAQAIFDKIEEELGLKVLASYDSGMRHIANNQRPIEKVEDMQGLKLRVAPTDCLIKSFEAMGASPSTMNYGELYTGLQNKVIDGEEINITSIYSEKHYEVLKYFTEIGLYPFETTIICNADWFNSLDPKLQTALEDGFINGYNYVFDKYLKETEEAGYAAMEDAGIEIIKIDDPSDFKAAILDVTNEIKNSDPLITAFVEMCEKLD